MTSTNVTKITGTSGEEVQGHTSGPVITGSHILSAAGRIPNTDDMGATSIGLELSDNGHVVVDEQLQTSAEGVYAVGDCANSPHFTHIGYDDSGSCWRI